MALCIFLIYGLLLIHFIHGYNGAFSRSLEFGVNQIFFLHRLNGKTFSVYRQYPYYRKILCYGSLVMILSIFVWRHNSVAA